MLPGLFPIVAAGGVLWLPVKRLQFASIVALIVAFGLGLHATIHYLNRLRLEDSRTQGGKAARASMRESATTLRRTR